MFISTKYKVLEIILAHRNSSFDVIRVALMSGLPELSWEEITDYIELLKSEGYVSTLYGDNELWAVAVQRGARARLRELYETADNETKKEFFGKILGLVKFSI